MFRPGRRDAHGIRPQQYLCVAALLTSTSASAASGWWNPDWQYRKAITLQLPASDSGGLTSSIVLPIRLHSGNFNYFQDLQPNAADLRFIAADGTSLKYQLELLDPALGLLIAWASRGSRSGGYGSG